MSSGAVRAVSQQRCLSIRLANHAAARECYRKSSRTRSWVGTNAKVQGQAGTNAALKLKESVNFQSVNDRSPLLYNNIYQSGLLPLQWCGLGTPVTSPSLVNPCIGIQHRFAHNRRNCFAEWRFYVFSLVNVQIDLSNPSLWPTFRQWKVSANETSSS